MKFVKSCPRFIEKIRIIDSIHLYLDYRIKKKSIFSVFWGDLTNFPNDTRIK